MSVLGGLMCFDMSVFEVFYKKTENGILLSSVRVVRHGLYLPYCIPFVAFLSGIRSRCAALCVLSVATVLLLWFSGGFNGILIIKALFLLAFAAIVPLIKRTDLVGMGYLNGGCFVVRDEYAAVSGFFSKMRDEFGLVNLHN